MSNGTPSRRVLVIGHSHALAVALATPIREGDVAVSREPYPPAIRAEAPTLDRDAFVVPVVTDALAHLRRPKREGNRAARRAKGRGR